MKRAASKCTVSKDRFFVGPKSVAVHFSARKFDRLGREGVNFIQRELTKRTCDLVDCMLNLDFVIRPEVTLCN